MKSVKFKSQFKCSADGGKTVSKFNKGDEVDLPDDVAESAVKSGAAAFAGSDAPKRKAKKPVADKSKDSSSEDK